MGEGKYTVGLLAGACALVVFALVLTRVDITAYADGGTPAVAQPAPVRKPEPKAASGEEAAGEEDAAAEETEEPAGGAEEPADE
jgi:hypothetical protein